MLTLSGAGQPQNGGAGIEERFVISVKTDNAGGSADNQFTLPTTGGGYNYDIETSDGQTITGNTGNTIITFPSPGIYDIMISGDFPRYRGVYSPDPRKLIDIKNWGINPWLSFDGSFEGALMTIITAADIPNLESVESMKNMFANTAYNLQSIPNIENWNVSNVTSTQGMFAQSSIIINPQFPIDLSSWDVSSLINMSYMFYTVQQPTVLTFDLSNWDISNVTDSTNLFRTGGFASAALYNNTLISWASQNVNNNININFGNSQYSYEASAARQTLIDTYGWTITDGGQVAIPEFVIHVKTDEGGVSNDNQFELPWVGTYDVDWGDNTVETGVVDAQTHTYASVGTYYIKVTATSGKVRFNNNGDKFKLLYIANWGNCEWTDMDLAFDGCKNLDMLAEDIPNFNSVTTTRAMFRNCEALIANPSIANWDMSNVTILGNGWHYGMFTYCKKFNQPIGNWDVSNVTNMNSLFVSNEVFNQPLNNWDVSSLTDAQLMFRNCKLFNQPLNNWNVSNLNRMAGIFRGAHLFNQDIGGWNVSNVTQFADGFHGAFQDAYAFNNGGSDSIKNWNVTNTNGDFGGQYGGGVFRNAKSFNQPINNWDVSNVTDMRNVFIYTDSFNQPLDNWNVSNVTKMDNTFREAKAFDQSLANWDIRQVTGFTGFMLAVSNFSVSNYDATLISWAAQTLNSNISIDFGTSRYTAGGSAEAARNTLINTYGWTITDGGAFNTPISGLLFDYPGSIGAYSLRQLVFYQDGHTPNLIRVRRSSDNAEQDFTATEITDGTLTTFTGANDGFITTWYNQASNIGDLISATAANQPQIVSSGTSLGYIQSLGSTQLNSNIKYTNGTDYSTFFVGQNTDRTVWGTDSKGGFYAVALDGGSQSSVSGFTEGNRYSNGSLIGATWGDMYNALSSFAQVTALVQKPGIDSNIRIGFNGYNNGRYKELIIYGNQSVSRTGVETNIIDHYNF